MIRSQKIILIIAAAVLVGSAGVFGIVLFATWGEYDYSNTYYYEPEAPSAIERINLMIDLGGINIKYNETPIRHYAKIDLDVKVKGVSVTGKSFSDFFKPIQWLNSSAPVTFNFETKSTAWFFIGISYRIKIDLTLRTDITYDIDAISATGAIIMNVPQGSTLNKTTLHTSTGSVLLNTALNTTFQGDVSLSTSTGSTKVYAVKTTFTSGLVTSTSTGSLTLNFTSCILGDDLSGVVSTGSIAFKSYNMKCTQDSTWSIETATGSIDADIIQYVDTGADIIGSIKTSTGSIDVIYKDNQANVGASFTSSTSTGSIDYNNIGVGGFSELGSIFSSLDYLTANNTFTFTLSTSTGNVEVDGESA